MSPASIIRQYLIDVGEGSVSGSWPVFVSAINDTPDNQIVVYDTAGENQGRLQRTGQMINRPGVQVRVRALNYPDAETKARAIAGKLDAARNVTVGTTPNDYLVGNISRRGDVLPMGVETENNRSRFNFTVNAVVIYSKG
jgi:hypothetical protein